MDSLKNIFISRPFDNTSDLIRNIGENMNHHLVFKNNTLVKIVNIHLYSNDILEMKEGNQYEFINGFPKPFYDFYNKYYNDETKIYAIYLSDEELKKVLDVNNLVNTIYNNNDTHKFNYIHNLLSNTYDQYKSSSYCI